jgi:hypothetical protein
VPILDGQGIMRDCHGFAISYLIIGVARNHFPKYGKMLSHINIQVLVSNINIKDKRC